MKPTNNRIFCYGCRRPKMLFESQSKADNFIRYNGEDIRDENGKSPVRSYYCELCGGYHVTSNPSKVEGERLNQRDRHLVNQLSSLTKVDEEIKTIGLIVNQRLINVDKKVNFCKFSEAEDLLDICNLELDDLTASEGKSTSKLTSLRARVRKMYLMLEQLKELIALPQDELLNFINDESSVGDKARLRTCITNGLAVTEIDRLLEDCNNLLASNQKQGWKEKLDRCKELLESLKGVGRKDITAQYNIAITELTGKLRKGETTTVVVSENANRSIEDCSSKEYKLAILGLIERLENIEKDYKIGNYDECQTQLEIAFYMFGDLQIDDENSRLIKSHLDKWASLLL